MEIVATPLTLCNPFDQQNETERSFIVEKIVIVAVPILTSGAIGTLGVLAVIQGSALGWLIPTAIAGGIAAGSGVFVIAVFSVAFTRLSNQEFGHTKEDEEDLAAPEPVCISIIQPDYQSSGAEDLELPLPPEEFDADSTLSSSTEEIIPNEEIEESSSSEEVLEEDVYSEEVSPENVIEMIEESASSGEEEEPSLFPEALFTEFIDWFFTPHNLAEETDGHPTPEQLIALSKGELKLSPESRELIELMFKEHRSALCLNQFIWLRHISEIENGTKKPPKMKRSKESREDLGIEAEGKAFLEEMKQGILEAFRDNWEECAQGYPEGYLEEAFAHLLAPQKTPGAKLDALIATAALAPFILRFYRILGDERKEILPWFRGKVEAFILDKLPADQEHPKAVQGLRKDILTLFEKGNDLLGSDDFKGKKFLTHLMGHYAFDVFPGLMKKGVTKETKAMENKRLRLEKFQAYHDSLTEKMKEVTAEDPTDSELSIIAPFKEALQAWGENLAMEEELPLVYSVSNRVIANETLPFLGRVANVIFETDSLEIDEDEMTIYLDRLDAISSHAKKEKVYLRREEPLFPPQTKVGEHLDEEVEEFGQLIDSLSGDFGTIYKKILRKDLPAVATLSKYETNYKEFLGDTDKVLTALTTFLAETFGDSVESPGEYAVKTFLISGQLFDVFPDKASRVKLAGALLEFCIEPIEQAGIDTKALKEFTSKGLGKILDGLEEAELDKGKEETFRIVPLHDIALMLLTTFFVAKHADLARPWLAKHQTAIIEILMDSGIEEIQQHERGIKFALGTLLSLMKPFNGLFLGGYKGKSAMLSGAIDLLFVGFKKMMIDEKKRKLKKLKKPIPKNTNDLLSTEEILMVEVTKPIIKFLILGLFGTNSTWGWGGNEKKAFALFESKLTTFYQGLYDFDAQEMTADKEALRAHIREKFDTLLDNKSS